METVLIVIACVAVIGYVSYLRYKNELYVKTITEFVKELADAFDYPAFTCMEGEVPRHTAGLTMTTGYFCCAFNTWMHMQGMNNDERHTCYRYLQNELKVYVEHNLLVPTNEAFPFGRVGGMAVEERAEFVRHMYNKYVNKK